MFPDLAKFDMEVNNRLQVILGWHKVLDSYATSSMIT